jgi:Ca2+-binding RTX toxin-like protein
MPRGIARILVHNPLEVLLKTLLLRPVRLALLLSICGLATAAAASAATVSYDGTTMTYNAAAGEVNNVNVDQSGAAVTINDSTSPVTADATAVTNGCSQDDPNTVTCPTVAAITINLGDMNDSLDSTTSVTAPENVDGGAGNDRCLSGGAGNDVIHGGAGDDCIYGDTGNGTSVSGNDQIFGDDGSDDLRGQSGNDLVSGGAGDDFVTGGPGADQVNGDAGDDYLEGGPGLGTPADNGDVISGGSGIDTYDYFHNSSDNTTPVNLTLDGQANDGLAGEGDNILSDVEDIQASVSNPTTITGTAAANSISGGNGNDVIDPSDGNDFVFAGGGDDTVNTNDGYVDRVSCGDGADTVNADEFDIVSDDCETVHRTTRGSLATEDHPPTISWVTPAENAVMSTTAPNALTVNAADDRGISQVIFLSGERILCTVTAAPYTCAYKPIDADVGKDTLTAMVIDTSQQSATALRTVSVPRFRPVKVSSKTTPTRDRKSPFKFKTTGSITLPPGVTAAVACKGDVGVVFKAGSKTISSRTAHLSTTCKFSRSVTFKIPRRLHPKTLKVEVRFRGNAVLSARSAKSRRVKVR